MFLLNVNLRQGVVINLISFLGAFHTVGSWSVPQITTGLQDFLICVEMFVISVSHSWVFGYEEYRIVNKEEFFQSNQNSVHLC